VADDGLTLHHHVFTENLAHALLLAVDNPAAAAGLVFNVGDEEVLSIRQVISLVGRALGRELDVVSMPFEIALPARPLLAQPLPTHRVLDISRVQRVLAYHDVVPAREAIGRTARWLAEHPCEPGGQEELVLTDPFDYAAEDRLIVSWRRALASLDDARFAVDPGYGLAYSGPASRSHLHGVRSVTLPLRTCVVTFGRADRARAALLGARAT
jgi:hypothetical protein